MGHYNKHGGYVKSNSEIAWLILFSMFAFWAILQSWVDLFDKEKEFSWFLLLTTPLVAWFAWGCLKSAIGNLRCREDIDLGQGNRNRE